MHLSKLRSSKSTLTQNMDIIMQKDQKVVVF